MSKQRKADGRAPIYARITIEGGGSKEISTGVWILPEHWDIENKLVICPKEKKHEGTEESPEEKQQRKQRELEARIDNDVLSEVRTDLKNHFHVLKMNNRKVTAAMLKEAYEGEDEETKEISATPEVAEQEEEHTLKEAFDCFINDFQDAVDEGKKSKETLKHWRTTRNKINSFVSYKYKQEDILLSKIKFQFANDFFKYLTTKVAEPLAEVTAMKHIKCTKQILSDAMDKEWLPQNPIARFKCTGESPDVKPLELYEVHAIYYKKKLVKRLEEVRDVFVFQCFTGFAFQDLYDLSPEHIVLVGPKAERWLIKKRGKTAITEMVPILPIVEKIIEKYRTHPYCMVNNKLLPVNSNARYNGYLKELAVVCNIKREDIILNTHLARHTFADIMLNMGVPLEDVSKMLGHKSIRTTQRYCRVRKHRISKNMKANVYSLFTKDGRLRKVLAA